MKWLVGATAAAVVLVRPLGAQGHPQCAAYTDGDPHVGHPAYNLCNAAIDGAAVFTPAVGILVTGGNPMPGSTTGMGGFGRMGVTLRVNATTIVIPDPNYDGAASRVGAKPATLAPAPLVEAGFGLVRGLRHGELAVDLLGSAELLPTRLVDDVRLDVNARAIGSVAVGLGIGARVTALTERGPRPGITISAVHRSLPRMGVGDVLLGDQLSYAMDLGATEYRAVVGKHAGVWQVALGGGWTDYQGRGDATFRDPSTGAAAPAASFTIHDSRTTGFVDVGARVGGFNLIGEAGVQQGRDLAQWTTFDGNDPRQPRVYGSLGLRLGFE